MDEKRFLASWVGGSAAASLLGLGIGGFLALMGLHSGLATAVPSALVLTAVITLTVGLVQGTVLAARFTRLSAPRWAALTGLGTLGAWAVIGYPVRMLTRPDAEVDAWATVLPLAVLIGGTVGVLVSWAQWFELRRHATHALRSIPLLAVAWTLGALILFAGNGLLAGTGSEAAAVATGAAVLLLAAAVVAAIQGLGLLRILRA